MLSRIDIKDLRIEAIVGVGEDERLQEQTLRVDLSFWLEVEKAARQDRIQETVDYHSVATDVDRWARDRKRYTLEALSFDICDGLLEKYSKIEEIKVEIKKPTAIEGAEYASVTTTRKRQTAPKKGVWT